MGVVVGVVVLLRNSVKNSHFLHKESKDNGGHTVKMTLAEEVSFLNKGAILKDLNNLPKGTHLIIDMSHSISIDYDVLEIIDNYKKTAKDKGVIVDLINRGEKPTVDY